MDNRVVSLLEEQNAILKAQLAEQKMVNQQMFEMLKMMSAALNLSGMNVNQVPEQQEQESESLKAFL